MNLNDVAHTATNADTGTAFSMSMLKNINIIGILLPAPDRPPALDNAIKIHIKKSPIPSMT
tara:strand:+ start:630 stop:812 length:183 start_codon:yes stop_codon:yes gene_type:complete